MNFLLQHLAADSARRAPEKCAIRHAGAEISYGELEAQSTRLGRFLNKNGCQRGERVGLFLPKSIPAYVGIHGILKAGAAYVPLDPRAPADRLSYILEDCSIERLLTVSSHWERASQLREKAPCLESLIVLDDGTDDLAADPGTTAWAEVEKQSHEPLELPIIETDLAYLLYTSGSTGRPKGVMITHLNSLTFVRWAVSALDVRSDDRISAHAPLHFDLSIFDLFASMAVGATLVPVPDGVSSFPIRLADWIAEEQVSIWYSVPSILSMLVHRGQIERHQFENLRTILFAGEVFPVRFLNRWLDQLPRVDFYNLYGPTETNVITSHKVERRDSGHSDPVAIGRACTNMDVFAVDEHDAIIEKPGERGELIARGSCVAVGYWGDEEKTRASFVPDRWQQRPGGTAYRTGDLVAVDENGDYHFVGRLDFMVKSRGYRIELGEVESALYSHPAAVEVVVIAVEDELIGNRLHAFVVRSESSDVSERDLTTHAAGRLPKYMIPETIAFLPRLPKTATDKVDRTALVARIEQGPNG